MTPYAVSVAGAFFPAVAIASVKLLRFRIAFPVTGCARAERSGSTLKGPMLMPGGAELVKG